MEFSGPDAAAGLGRAASPALRVPGDIGCALPADPGRPVSSATAEPPWRQLHRSLPVSAHAPSIGCKWSRTAKRIALPDSAAQPGALRNFHGLCRRRCLRRRWLLGPYASACRRAFFRTCSLPCRRRPARAAVLALPRRHRASGLPGGADRAGVTPIPPSIVATVRGLAWPAGPAPCAPNGARALLRELLLPRIIAALALPGRQPDVAVPPWRDSMNSSTACRPACRCSRMLHRIIRRSCERILADVLGAAPWLADHLAQLSHRPRGPGRARSRSTPDPAGASCCAPGCAMRAMPWKMRWPLPAGMVRAGGGFRASPVAEFMEGPHRCGRAPAWPAQRWPTR